MHLFPSNCTIKFFIKTNFTFALSAFSIEILKVLVPYHFSFFFDIDWIYTRFKESMVLQKKEIKGDILKSRSKIAHIWRCFLPQDFELFKPQEKHKEKLICHLNVTSANSVHNWGISLSHLLITSSSKVGSLSRVFLVWVLGICVFIFYFNGDSLHTRMSSYYKVGVKKRRR